MQTLHVMSGGFGVEAPYNGAVTFPLNAAATWLAFSFIPTEDKTITEVRMFVSAVTGSPSAAHVTCEIYSDNASFPVSSLAGPQNCAVTPVADYLDWTGFTLALTKGVMYWIVFKNASPTPTTAYPTFRYLTLYSSRFSMGAIAYGWSKRQSADSGATWATSAQSSITGPRVKYSDNTYDGIPINNFNNTVIGDRVYDTRALGNRFTSPIAIMRIKAVSILMTKAGTPTSNLCVKIFFGTDTTPSATSYAIPAANAFGTGYGRVIFDNAVELPSNSNFRVVTACVTPGDTSANGYGASELVFDDSDETRALLFWRGQKTFFDGTNFTDTPTKFIPMQLELEVGNEVYIPSGGGTPRSRVQLGM